MSTFWTRIENLLTHLEAFFGVGKTVVQPAQPAVTADTPPTKPMPPMVNGAQAVVAAPTQSEPAVTGINDMDKAAAPVAKGQPTSVVFDPAAYSDPEKRVEALHALEAAHPYPCKIVAPSGNEIDQEGLEIKPQVLVDETTLELDQIGDGRHPRVDLQPGQSKDKPFGPYAAGAKFVVETIEADGDDRGSKVALDVLTSGGAVLSSTGGSMRNNTASAVITSDGASRYVARISNPDTLPISVHVQVNKVA